MKKILFCAGKVGRRVLAEYGKKDVLAFCDNNLTLHGTYIDGVKVISFSELLNIANNVEVILCTSDIDNVQYITKQLETHGISYRHYNELDTNHSNIKASFTKIYENNEWGTGETRYYSGSGSHEEDIINPYIRLVYDFIQNNDVKNIVEIGCGDFYIMNRILLMTAKYGMQVSYSGLDVVEDLIKYNNNKYGNDNISFFCADAISDSCHMPEGDLLIIRQVLQHLDNASIMKILDKISGYRYVLITEHIYEGKDAIFNVDKKIDESIRLNMLSGVYLEKSPYNYKNIAHLLRVPEDGGIIRTSLIINC